jgi:hypothetical protein
VQDLLQQGSGWLSGMRHKHLSREVQYHRGAESVALRATVGRTLFEEADEFGVVKQREARDYIVRAQDLVLNAGPTLPLRGDQIVEADGRTFEVMAMGNEPPWRYSDPERLDLRIHTKVVDYG